MLADIRVLLEIQELDKEILELRSQLSKYPVIWEEVKTKLTQKKEAVEAARENREKHIKERRRVEARLRVFSDELRRSQTQQTAIQTSREYEAINKQIDATKKKIAQAEEQGLALIDKDDEMENSVTAAEAELKKLEELYSREKERIRDQFNEKKTHAEKLEKEKAKQLARVAPEYLQAYERVSRRYPGSALAAVHGASCSGCHWQLVPNQMVHLHTQAAITFCTNCNRILTEDEDYRPGEKSE